MKEIKFRAWEKATNQIIPVYNIDFGVEIINKDSAWRTFKEIEIMQYTCLKDRNGTEIYEGDIVSVWRDGINKIFTVKWRDTGVPMYILYPQPINENFWHCRSDMDMSWEVIGNIYENPDLLKGC